VPVQFLSDEQARRYGSPRWPIHRAAKPVLLLGSMGQEDIDLHRDDRARLDYAVQLGCVRFLGCFSDLVAIPTSVVRHVADAVGARPAVFATYPMSRTRLAHAVGIRTRYGQPSFDEGLPTGCSCGGSTTGYGRPSDRRSWSIWPP